MSDMVQKGINAETFISGSVEGLVEALVKLSTNKDLMAQYALGSKRIGERDFSVEERARRTLMAYYDVIE